MYCKQVASIFLSKVSLIQKDLEKCLANIVNYVGVRIYQGIRMIKRSEQYPHGLYIHPQRRPPCKFKKKMKNCSYFLEVNGNRMLLSTHHKVGLRDCPLQKSRKLRLLLLTINSFLVPLADTPLGIAPFLNNPLRIAPFLSKEKFHLFSKNSPIIQPI